MVNYGYDLFLKSNKLSWPGTETQFEWKKRMLQPTEYFDEIALNLASNVLGVDIIVIPAFRESSIHQGLGVTIIKSQVKPKNDPLFVFLFSESDFQSPHFQSIRPKSDDNVLSTFLSSNNIDESRSCLEVTGQTIQDILSYLILSYSRRPVVQSQPRLPAEIPCCSSQCSHLVIYDHHYDRQMYEDFRLEDQCWRDQQRNMMNDEC